MGYSLTIGELKSEIIEEGLESRLHNFAEDVKLPNAPAFGEPTDYMNCRWPSYTSWAQSMRTVGLYDFMYDKQIGLLRNHPGCVPLTKEHRDVFNLSYSEFYKNSKYHLSKTLDCLNKDVQLLHIWEDDWMNKREIVKSIILNRLKLIANKISARKCLIKYVNSKDARKFLNENHIQGFSNSSIKIGLYNGNELVSLMTFGFRYTNGKKEYELIRFCNKINTVVVGAASKIFKFFLKNSDEVFEIISYADISLFSGSLYKTMSFRKVSLSEPNYFWVVDDVRRHRFNYSKKKLVKQGYNIDKTELEIMYERGYYRVFSCGQEKWVYNKII